MVCLSVIKSELLRVLFPERSLGIPRRLFRRQDPGPKGDRKAPLKLTPNQIVGGVLKESSRNGVEEFVCL